MSIPIIGNNSPKLIEGDDKKRAAKCMQRISKLLQQYDCAMMPELTIIGDGSVKGRILIKPMLRTGHQQGGNA